MAGSVRFPSGVADRRLIALCESIDDARLDDAVLGFTEEKIWGDRAVIAA